MVSLAHHPCADEGIDARANLAAVYSPLPGNLSVVQNLKVFGLLYGVAGLSGRIEALLRQFDLVALRSTRCGVLSSGEQTRVSPRR